MLRSICKKRERFSASAKRRRHWRTSNGSNLATLWTVDPSARHRRDAFRYTVRFYYSSSSLSHRLPSFQRMPVHGFSAPLKFTFHVPAWTPSPASMRSPTISPSKAQVRSLYFSTLSGEHARKTLSPMPLGPTSVPAL